MRATHTASSSLLTDILLLKLSSQVPLDEGRLPGATVTHEDTLQPDRRDKSQMRQASRFATSRKRDACQLRYAYLEGGDSVLIRGDGLHADQERDLSVIR